MLLNRSQVLALDEAAIRAFLERRARESAYLDYKVALSGDTEREQRWEFLKDVTGFANALGGHILIGAKEPVTGLAGDQQLVGIPDGDKVAKALEDVVRDATDPRVPGFFIHSIKLTSGKCALVAHVPASSMRPHLVDYGGRREVYIRRGASTVPMTVHELSEQFLGAVTTQARVRGVFAARRDEALMYYADGAPVVLLQAAPLIQLDEPWDLDLPALEDCVRGSSRRHAYQNYTLDTEYAPRITIDGSLALNNPERPEDVWEVHKSGYVSALTRVRIADIEKAKGVPLLYTGYQDFFFAFADLLEECWRVTGLDAPYAISCELTPALGSYFKRYGYGHGYDIAGPYRKNDLVWPVHQRRPGQPAIEIARLQIAEMYNAFGLRAPAEIPSTRRS